MLDIIDLYASEYLHNRLYQRKKTYFPRVALLLPAFDLRMECTCAFSLIYRRGFNFLRVSLRFLVTRSLLFCRLHRIHRASLRGWEIVFPLVDEWWCTIEVARMYIRGGEKQNRQCTARFRLESYQSQSGVQSYHGDGTCYLLYAPGYRGCFPPSLPLAHHNGVPSMRHRYPWSTYIHASISIVCLFALFNTRALRESGVEESGTLPASRDFVIVVQAGMQSRELNGDHLVFTPVINVRTPRLCAISAAFMEFNARCSPISDFCDRLIVRFASIIAWENNCKLFRSTYDSRDAERCARIESISSIGWLVSLFVRTKERHRSNRVTKGLRVDYCVFREIERHVFFDARIVFAVGRATPFSIYAMTFIAVILIDQEGSWLLDRFLLFLPYRSPTIPSTCLYRVWCWGGNVCGYMPRRCLQAVNICIYKIAQKAVWIAAQEKYVLSGFRFIYCI